MIKRIDGQRIEAGVVFNITKYSKKQKRQLTFEKRKIKDDLFWPS